MNLWIKNDQVTSLVFKKNGKGHFVSEITCATSYTVNNKYFAWRKYNKLLAKIPNQISISYKIMVYNMKGQYHPVLAKQTFILRVDTLMYTI